MICCKITADYTIICRNFEAILKQLSQNGIVLWDNQKLYFANVDNPKIGETFVKKVLKKNNCNNFFLEIYNATHEPCENDSANYWIENQLVAIGYAEVEKNQQDLLKQMSEQLTQIDEELTKALSQPKEDTATDQ